MSILCWYRFNISYASNALKKEEFLVTLRFIWYLTVTTKQSKFYQISFTSCRVKYQFQNICEIVNEETDILPLVRIQHMDRLIYTVWVI